MATTDALDFVHAPQDIRAFVEQLIARLAEEGLYYAGPDRRAEVRHAVALRVAVTPLDRRLLRTSESFVTTTRNISGHGIALVHSAALDCPYLAVELTDIDGRSLVAAVEVLRCQPLNSCFEIAGQFVTKVYKTPRPAPDLESLGESSETPATPDWARRLTSRFRVK